MSEKGKEVLTDKNIKRNQAVKQIYWGMYLTMMRYVWKIISRHSSCTVVAIIPLILLLNFGYLLLKNAQRIDELQNFNEQIQEENEDIENRLEDSIEYQEKLSNNLAECQSYNQQLNESIEGFGKKSMDESQAFHGEWWVRAVYKTDVGEWQWCEGHEKIYFEKEYIYLINDRITDKPIYAITICNRDKILNELSNMGINSIEPLDTDICSMLNSDYYVEMDFSQTYNWNDAMNLSEESWLKNAKYYPIDLKTMLCIMRNDGGRVYLLDRIMIPGGRLN